MRKGKRRKSKTRTACKIKQTRDKKYLTKNTSERRMRKRLEAQRSAGKQEKRGKKSKRQEVRRLEKRRQVEKKKRMIRKRPRNEVIKDKKVTRKD